ncbi:UDP-N-acetylmuramoyl-L-alanine--D-glutamate ligase [Planctomycetota bacterium]|nr:UDP-N-acetylmuramoyl-L-alanine--D-glutamate ligase [Planctomycetota bacterium]
MIDFADKQVVVMGLGRFGGGVGVTKWLIAQGADVLVTDMGDAESLADSVAALDGLDVQFRLGEHNVSDFTKADVVVVNPAVSRENNRFVRAADAAGVVITSEIELVMERLPNKRNVIGVTGTAGKSTVCAMLGEVLSEWGEVGGEAKSIVNKGVNGFKCWVGGNIGGSLLGQLSEISKDDWVVLELSSFMLEGMRGKQSAWGGQRIAIITSFGSNHLDWHGHVEAYRDSKRVLLDGLVDGGVAILGEGVVASGFKVKDKCELVEVCAADVSGVEMVLPGEHNRMNGGIVKAVCDAIDVDELWESVGKDVVARFSGLPHRMQFVGAYAVGDGDEVRVYNDSKCTTVDGAILGMHSFEKDTVHVVVGGYDKGDDYERLGFEAAAWCKGVYAIGAVSERIVKGGGAGVISCRDLDAAVQAIAEGVGHEDVVLLSTGCASWDQFANYEERGEAFMRLVDEVLG